MIFSKKNSQTKYLLFVFIFILIPSIHAFSGTNDTIPIGKRLRTQGFPPAFSIGTGAVSVIGYGTYGIYGRIYIPLILEFRIAADYTDFIIEPNDWEKESHSTAALQYPLFQHGRFLFYSSLGLNLIIDKTIKEHSFTNGGNNYTFRKGTDYYVNPMFGMGAEFKITKTLKIYNEWNMVNEEALKTMLGLKIDLISFNQSHK